MIIKKVIKVYRCIGLGFQYHDEIRYESCLFNNDHINHAKSSQVSVICQPMFPDSQFTYTFCANLDRYQFPMIACNAVICLFMVVIWCTKQATRWLQFSKWLASIWQLPQPPGPRHTNASYCQLACTHLYKAKITLMHSIHPPEFDINVHMLPP